MNKLLHKLVNKWGNKWLKKRTNNYTKIPLFQVVFDYQHYIEKGEKGSCQIYLHPDISYADTELQEKMFDIIDYIRDKYDMERFTKL